MNKRTKTLGAVVLLALVLSGVGIGVRIYILRQIRTALESTIRYAGLRLSAFPPTLVLDDVRSISAYPSFSARKVTIRTSFPALLQKSRTLRITIEHPVVGISESLGPAKSKITIGFALPFAVESGVIEDGELHYSGSTMGFTATGIRGLFRQQRGVLTLKLESGAGSLVLDRLRSPLTGRISLQAEGKGNVLTLDKVNFAGPDFVGEMSGVLSNPSAPEFNFQVDLRAPASLIADVARLPFTWGGRVEAGGRLTRSRNQTQLGADVKSSDVVLNAVPLGRLEGNVTLNDDASGRAELAIQRSPNPRETLDITFGNGRVVGLCAGVHIDPFIHNLNLPWPVASPAWGEFTLDDRELEIRGEFRDEPSPPENGRFHFRGPAHFTWDRKLTMAFDSDKLETSFGAMQVQGGVELDHSVQVEIKGDVSDVRGLRLFTERILREELSLPEILGKGRADVKILGHPSSPQVKAEFDASFGNYDGLEAASVSGQVEIAKREVTGLFKVQDADMRGTIRVVKRPLFIDVQVHAEETRLERILPWLNLKVPLSGRASGDFEVVEAGPGLRVTGDFSSPSVAFSEREFENPRGKFEWTKETGVLAVSNLEATIFGGRLKGAGVIGFRDRNFDLDVAASDVKLESLDPRVSGLLSFNLKGKGILDRDAAAGKFTVKNIRTGRAEEFEAGGDVQLTYQDNRLEGKLDGLLDPGRNNFSLSFGYMPADGTYQATLKGSLSNFGRLLPWKGVMGEVSYLAEIKGPGSPQISGVLDIKGSVMPLPKFPQAITDYSALVLIQNNRASIRSLQAKLGGGDVFGSGEVRFGRSGPEFIDVRIDGKDMALALVDRVRGLADGTLRLVKDESRFVLSGDLQFKSLLWKRDLSEKLIFSQTSYLRQAKSAGFFDNLALDIRLRGPDNAFLDNSMGRVDCRFDLTLSGFVNSPIVLGEIDAVRGEVYFQDRTFRVLKARLSFFNPSTFEPYLDFQGETFLRDYRVTFSLTGLIPNQLKPEFSSSPPLPPEDVLALLALGESFKRTYSYDVSSQIGTGSLLSFQLAEGAARQAERLFSLDRFRIDPFVLGATTEMTARLTVGKKISSNIILLYSTNLSGQREEIVRLEWEFTGSFSLVGMRDEDGRFSLDAKVRKRF